MPNQLNIAVDIDQPAALVEVSTDSGTTFVDLTVPAAGTHKTGNLLNVPAGTYGIGVIKLRAKGYPGSAVSNTAAVTVAGAATTTITGFTPVAGAGGSTVVLTGTNFTGATLVSINSGAVASYVVDSATQITAVLNSAQTTGKVRVTAGGQTAVSAADFTVNAPAAPAAPADLTANGRTASFTPAAGKTAADYEHQSV